MEKIKTFWSFFIEKYRFTLLLIASFSIFGLVTLVQIPKESNPEVEIPYAVVVTVYPGAGAEDVEELITKPIEDKIKSLDEIDKLTSQSRNNVSSIFVQFDANADAKEKINELKSKVDEAKSSLPEDAMETNVTQISLDDVPILTFSISGPYEESQLKSYADLIQARLEAISGVSQVNIIGGRDKEIKVIVDKAKLDSYNLSLFQVNQSISSANSDIPIGSIESAGMEYTLRFEGRLKNIEDVKNIPLTKISEAVIMLKDVANVYEGRSDENSRSRLSKNGDEAVTAISLSLYKAVGGDTTRIVNQALSSLEFSRNSLPDNLSFDISKNTGKDIKDDLNNLLVNGLETVVIVIALLFLFLGWKEALLTGLSVPITFFMSFIFLNSLGYTLNFLTLFSLILSLGILVDNAIVIAEGIYVNIKKGMHVKEAAMSSVKEFQWALTAGTLTTVFAFLPLIGVRGIIGKFMISIPITISAVLLSSLFVALALIPSVASLVFKKTEDAINHGEDVSKTLSKGAAKKDRLMEEAATKYSNSLRNLLEDKKKGAGLMKYIIIAFIFSISLPISGVLKADMFPVGKETKVYIDVKFPLGTPLETNDQKIKQIEEILLNDKNVDSFLTSIGSQTGGGGIGGGSSASNSHYAGIIVNLNKKYKGGSTEFIKEYSEKLSALENWEINLSQDVMGPSSADPISISVSGDDLETLDNLGQEIKNILENIPGTNNIRYAGEESPGEIVLNVDRNKAQMYGVNASQIASILRVAISGIDSTVIRQNGEETNVVLKYDLDGKNDGISDKQIDLNNIKSIGILTPQGEIPISYFVQSDLDYARSLVQRRDGDRIKEIIGGVKNGFSSQEIFATAKNAISKIEMPEGYEVVYGGENEDMQESFADIFKALIIGIILIACLLVLQFNSFKQPLFILVTIPLALIGVLPGLVLMGQPLSFPGAIGIVALVGIVVKNAIIMIEKINSNQKEGLKKTEAIIEAGTSRLRPIILTTITTVIGMIPLAMSDPTWGPLGYAIIFGLSFSTVLTLFVLPVIYHRYS